MQRRQRVLALWIALISAVVLSGIVIPLWVTADTEQIGFTATLYADVIRFEANGASRIFDSCVFKFQHLIVKPCEGWDLNPRTH